MKKIKYFCDLCGNQIYMTSWEEHLEPLKIISYVSSRNPLGNIFGNYQTVNETFDEVCDECRREYSYVVALFLKDKLNKNPNKSKIIKKVTIR